MLSNKNKLTSTKPFSLKTRLSLQFTALFFLLISTVAIFSYFTLIHLCHKTEYDVLTTELDTVKYIIQQKKFVALQHEIQDIPGIPKNVAFHYYIRVNQPNKNIYLETQGMSDIIPPASSDAKISSNKILKRFEKSKRSYFLLESTANIDDQVWTIQIVLDTTYQANLTKEYKRILIFMLISGAVLSSILGYFIMQRSIRSLIEMTNAARAITSSSLHQRLDAHYWPKEFSELGFAFNHMLERIEESFLRLRSFSADLAHELRTPINSLLGQTEVALLYPLDITEYRQTLESNLEDLQSIAAMIENLLFIAQAENPRLVLVKQKIEIHQVMHKIKNYYAEIAFDKSIDIEITGRASISFNPEMFDRMIGNLLSNAIKYTQQNGKIVLNISEYETTLAIKISDNGIGVSAEHIHRLFDRFYRIDQARARNSGGMGLGLAIVKSIVDLHRGKIHITSNEGVGTSVILEFPK
ncbi:MAG TPA: heavy metal sensor histidine kinase [Gammaproteobacteria bacterium]|jgi:two-component system heavy metal sensor histidine kinase CusS|nr:heavy metal sensor histidine kinase [Gammaproteobacteria bacterium]